MRDTSKAYPHVVLDGTLIPIDRIAADRPRAAAGAAGREAGTRPPVETARWEAGLLAVPPRWPGGVRPGDGTATAAVVARHPFR